MILRSNRPIFLALLLVATVVPFSKQQDDGSGGGDGDPYDDGSGNSDSSDDSSSGSQSDCALITGHSCSANGICKYCAMCLEDECILSKSVAANSTSEVSQTAPECSTAQLGTNVYNWYGYCLSSGNDNDGDYCATSVECYQYRKAVNGSNVSHLWQNLTCDANSCLLTTDRGGAPPPPGQLPPPSSTSSGDNQADSTTGAGEGNNSESGDHHYHEFSPRSATAIALMTTCSFIIVVGLLWLAQLWTKRRKRNKRPTLSVTSSIPSSAPPSFRSNSGAGVTSGAVAGAAAGGMREISQWRRLSRSSSLSSLHSVEPLPSYFSPDPSPPKYEQAIVTQIRGLMAARGAEEDDEDGVGEQHQHSDPLPPPMWLPIYFTPNQSAFSFGRLRRHPPFTGSSSRAPAGASSSSSSAIPSAHEQDNTWSDPMRAFWYHHQQQLDHLSRQHQHLPTSQSLTEENSSQEQRQLQRRSEDEDTSSNNT